MRRRRKSLGMKALILIAGLLLIASPICAQSIEDLKKGVVKITAVVEGKTKIGTGFVVRLEKNAAYIVTAAHVVEGDSNPKVSFFPEQNKEVTGKIVGIEGGDQKGLAVIQTLGGVPLGIEAFPIEQTLESTSGESLTLIGFPTKMSAPWAVVTGSLSGLKGRDLVITAPVSEGNSGGPVLVKGKVVGVLMEARKEFGLAVPSPILKIALKGWGIELPRRTRPIKLTAQPGYENKWEIRFDIADKTKEIFYRLPEESQFRSTGFFDMLDPETGLPFPKTSVQAVKRTLIEVKYTNAYGEEEGPYKLLFDPLVELISATKLFLRDFNWIELRRDRDENAKEVVRVWFSQLLSYKGAIKEIRYSLDNDKLDRIVKFNPVSASQGFVTISNDDQNYTQVSQRTKFVAVKVLFKDGTESEMRRFSNGTTKKKPPKGLTLTFVSAGYDHTCGITQAGAGYCWGGNYHGELGDGLERFQSSLASPIAGNLRWKSLVTGYDHTCGITPDGRAYCWGDNKEGQLGDGSTENQRTPVPVETQVRFSSLSVGSGITCGVSVKGEAYCWGDSREQTRESAKPRRVSSNLKFRDLAVSGYDDACAISIDHGVYCWKVSPAELIPQAVQGKLSWRSISGGHHHFCGNVSEGKTYCWGNNGDGQLGDGSTNNSQQPVEVIVNSRYTATAAGETFTCGLTTQHSAYCWGSRTVHWSEEDSADPEKSRIMPRRVRGDMGFISLSAGGKHVCGLTKERTVYCWGEGSEGQLGNGIADYSYEPVRVADPTDEPDLSPK